MFRTFYHQLRKYRVLNFFPRIFLAASYYNSKYLQILKWGFCSREDTNLTYDLTDMNLSYMAHTFSVVLQKPVNEIWQYIHEAMADSDLRDFVINRTRNSKFNPVADAKCCFGRRLGWYAVARAIKPKVIVESGVDKGLGAVLLCAALLKNKSEGHNGHYFGTDINPEAGYLLSGRYKEVGEIVYGDSIESLKKMQGPIDLFINDSDHSASYECLEYQTIRDKISSRAIIMGDNAHVTKELAQFSLENQRQFLFFREVPKDHWYPGAGIGISYTSIAK